MQNKLIPVDQPFLTDFDGSDALAKNQEEMKDKVVHFATASMPEVLMRALKIINESKNERNVLEAMKLVTQISNGVVKGKSIEGAVRKFSNDNLDEVLNGQE